ncbi:hypothetical protein BT63DRAFT_450161 [Microthyrium microscopicum]|uniref:G protein-coupled receptor GPR1/2/3 C-terminal domain-containing protein n=1 Tax=Microthyrium microscopicum TaxID=703497 RepID=A0A6A6UVS6_9PEZI|nr:hypothetical protein BT63DRAFT_450161 [Microthyrium microscopicum]
MPTPMTPADPGLSTSLRNGLIPLSIFAICSALSTFTLLAWITWRLMFRQDYQTFVGYNQYVILIYNLLLADLQQALAFLFSLHWLNIGKIDDGSVTCFTQGWLLNMGDVGSGMFVFAIALHTWYSVVLGRKLQYSTFTIGILCTWAFVFLLTVMGPATKGIRFFNKTNAWCWIDAQYDLDRLWFHYLWVFSVEFGTIIVYAHVFYHLRKRLSSIRSITIHDPAGPRRTERLSQAARYMVLYPIIYVILTLPLAAGRMAAMSGKTLPLPFYCMAGSFLTSCGWLDTLLYTLTRRVFIKSEGASVRDTRPATANTNKSAASRRWLKGKDEDRPMPHVADSAWHLSTFASVNMDTKDPMYAPGTAPITHASSEDLSETRMSGELRDHSHARSDTPLGLHTQSRSRTPILEPGHVGLTQTIIRSTATDESNDALRLPMNQGILSETKIEVVSVLRDDLISGNVHGGLSERNESRERSRDRDRSESRKR